MSKQFVRAAAIAIGAMTAIAATEVRADAVTEFYKGRTIQIIVAAGAGGVYGTVAQLLGRHLPRHMPGQPTVTPQYMPGAGGIKAANYLYNVAAKDGSAIGALFKDTPAFQVLRPDTVRYDAAKLNWLPSWGESASSITVWHAAPATTIADTKTREVVIGAFGKGSGTYQVPALLNNTIGTKFRIVTGYPGGAEVRVAMERGEVHGFAGFLSSWKIVRPDWVKENRLVHIVQIARRPSREAPDVPLLTTLAENEEQRRIFAFVSDTGPLANAFSTPPGVPADRLAALDKAIWAMLNDPAFVAEARERQLDVDPIPGKEVAEIVRGIVGISPALAARIRKVLEIE